MQSLMLGESNRKMKMVIFRELDKGEVLVHMKLPIGSPNSDDW